MRKISLLLAIIAIFTFGNYAYAQQNASSTTLVQLLKAMMKYGDAARAYVGK